METVWLLNVFYCWLQIQSLSANLANPSIYDLQRIGDIIPILDSFVQFVSDTVHTRGESPQDWLGDVQTCRTTLSSAYVLYHLSATWSQLQIRERSLR